MSNEKSKNDVVQEARKLLETHSIVAMRVDKPYNEIRPLISTLCDEVEQVKRDKIFLGERLEAQAETMSRVVAERNQLRESSRAMKEAIEAALLHLQDCGYKTNKEVQEQLIAAISPKGSEQ